MECNVKVSPDGKQITVDEVEVSGIGSIDDAGVSHDIGSVEGKVVSSGCVVVKSGVGDSVLCGDNSGLLVLELVEGGLISVFGRGDFKMTVRLQAEKSGVDFGLVARGDIGHNTYCEVMSRIILLSWAVAMTFLGDSTSPFASHAS